MQKLNLIGGGTLIVVTLLAGCSSLNSRAHPKDATRRFNDDQKHRLYSAALAASDSPMDTTSFAEVCRAIGIFDSRDKPNDQYLDFVSQHVAWASNNETEEFRQQISSKEKALEYIKQHIHAQ